MSSAGVNSSQHWHGREQQHNSSHHETTARALQQPASGEGLCRLKMRERMTRHLFVYCNNAHIHHWEFTADRWAEKIKNQEFGPLLSLDNTDDDRQHMISYSRLTVTIALSVFIWRCWWCKFLKIEAVLATSAGLRAMLTSEFDFRLVFYSNHMAKTHHFLPRGMGQTDTWHVMGRHVHSIQHTIGQDRWTERQTVRLQHRLMPIHLPWRAA